MSGLAPINKARPCWVYVISDGAGICKIGLAVDVQARLGQLQAGNPRVLRIAAAWRFWNVAQAEAIEGFTLANTGRHRPNWMFGEWRQCAAAPLCRLVERNIASFARLRVSEWGQLSAPRLLRLRSAVMAGGGLRILGRSGWAAGTGRAAA